MNRTLRKKQVAQDYTMIANTVRVPQEQPVNVYLCWEVESTRYLKARSSRTYFCNEARTGRLGDTSHATPKKSNSVRTLIPLSLFSTRLPNMGGREELYIEIFFEHGRWTARCQQLPEMYDVETTGLSPHYAIKRLVKKVELLLNPMWLSPQMVAVGHKVMSLFGKRVTRIKAARVKGTTSVAAKKEQETTKQTTFIIRGYVEELDEDSITVKWYGGDRFRIPHSVRRDDWDELDVGEWFKATVRRKRTGEVTDAMLIGRVSPPKFMTEEQIADIYPKIPAAELKSAD